MYCTVRPYGRTAGKICNKQRKKENTIETHTTSSTMAKKSTKQKELKKIVIPSNGSEYFKSIENTDIIEYVRCKLADAHLLKVPSSGRPAGGWSATGFQDEIWQGTVKVVNRADLSVILLIDKISNEVIAVCPLVDEDSVERCVDSSRYFVVRVNDDSDGSIKYIGIAFNERTAAFDFNVALETSRREKEGLLQIDEPAVYDMGNMIVESTPDGKFAKYGFCLEAR